jgi:signal transduction histidine kinase
MFTPLSIVLSIAAGIALSAGISALFVALRRQQPALHLSFAVICLLVALNDIAALYNYQNADPALHLTVLRVQLTLRTMIAVVAMWFAARLFGQQPIRLMALWTGFGMALIGLNSVTPNGLLFSEFRGTAPFVLPWGEQVFLPDGVPSPLSLLVTVFTAGWVGFVVYAAVQNYLRGDRLNAVSLGLGFALIAVGAIFDIVVALIGVPSIRVFPFTWTVLIVMIGVYFSNEIISAERSLRTYQDELESVVSSRTAELTDTNARLAREVETRAQAERALTARVSELNAINDVSHAVSTVDDVGSALNLITDLVRKQFNARACHLINLSHTLAQTPAVQNFLREYDVRHALAPGRSPMDMPLTAAVARQGEPVLMSNVHTNPLTQGFFTTETHAAMFVPLRTRGEVIGAIGVSRDDSTPGPFTESECMLFETFAADMAAALENARLYHEAQLTAVDIERQRLARELHDSVTQSLYSVTLLANGWGTMAANGKLSDVSGSFRQIVDVGQQALKEMRLLIHQLRPPVLEDIGLVGALQQRLDSVERRVDIATRLTTGPGVDAIDLDVQEQLFHITQEALNNSLRHAGAKHVHVDIRLDDAGRHIALTIEDDGRGFDERVVQQGMGTQNMRERAAMIHGDLQIHSQPDAGTRVEIVVSLDRQPSL